MSKDGKIVIVKWQDNKAIHLASNFVGIGEVDIVKRWNKSATKYEQIQRPSIVQLYNDGMGGVDLLDQLISYYRVFIKSRKWTLRVFTHFLDFAIVSSWGEYRKNAEDRGLAKKEILDLMHFRLEVANALLYAGQKQNTSKRGRPSNAQDFSPSTAPTSSKRSMEIRPGMDIRFDGIDHIPNHDGKKEASRSKMNCKTTQGTAGRTHFMCSKCNTHLCITKERNCFKEFHSK